MPQVPFRSAEQGAQPNRVDETFLAMAAAEFVSSARQSAGTAQAPTKDEPDAPTDR